jgi:hypothetical protein
MLLALLLLFSWVVVAFPAAAQKSLMTKEWAEAVTHLRTCTNSIRRKYETIHLLVQSIDCSQIAALPLDNSS